MPHHAEIEELLSDRAEWMIAYGHVARILGNVAILLDMCERGKMSSAECLEAVKEVMGDDPT